MSVSELGNRAASDSKHLAIASILILIKRPQDVFEVSSRGTCVGTTLLPVTNADSARDQVSLI